MALNAWRAHAAEEHEARLLDMRAQAAELRDQIAAHEAEKGVLCPDRDLLSMINGSIDTADAEGAPLWPADPEQVPASRQQAILEVFHTTGKFWPHLLDLGCMCEDPAFLLRYSAATGRRFPAWLMTNGGRPDSG